MKLSARPNNLYNPYNSMAGVQTKERKSSQSPFVKYQTTFAWWMAIAIVASSVLSNIYLKFIQ